jgi:hypothetical protein
MTRPDIESIQARVAKVSRGPWKMALGSDARWDVYITSCEGGNVMYRPNELPNAEFLAACREDVPAMLSYIRHLEYENARLRYRKEP